MQLVRNHLARLTEGLYSRRQQMHDFGAEPGLETNYDDFRECIGIFATRAGSESQREWLQRVVEIHL